MKHRQGLAAALLFCVMCTPVLMGAAAESEPETQDGETAQVETPPQPALYPIDIVYSEDDTAWRMEKVYQLDASADPSVIPTENFEQEGREYVFLDLLAEDQRETDVDPELAERCVRAAYEQQDEAAHGWRQHHRDGEDGVKDALRTR